MGNISVMILEDEFINRELVKKIFSESGMIDYLDTAETSMECLRKLQERKFDLIYLDIDLPDMKGNEMIRCIKDAGECPSIIFATGHDNYSVESYQLGAIDYITKPFTDATLLTSLMKAVKIIRERKSKNPGKIMLKSGSTHHFINPNDIIFFERQEKKIIAYLKRKQIEIGESLKDLETLLPSNFVRSHQGFLINVNSIKDLVPFNSMSFTVEFHGTKKQATLKRELYDTVKKLIT